MSEPDATDPHATVPRPAEPVGRRLPGVLGWLVAGALVPGAGLLAAGRRRTGLAVLAVWVVLVVAAGVLAWSAYDTVRGATDPLAALAGLLTADRLVVAGGALAGLAVAWAAVVVWTAVVLGRGAARAATPVRPWSRGRSAVVAVLATALAATGLVPAAAALDYGLVYRDMSSNVFAGNDSGAPSITGSSDPTGGRGAAGRPVDPWATTPRVNVLLIGSDAGPDREGIRTDTLIVASIDTATGRTLLVSLPRNLMRVPFPPGSAAARDYPRGFVCPDQSCMINALWQFGAAHRTQYYRQARTDAEAGLTATMEGVEQATGLRLDTYVMVDLRGFARLVDAVGGVRVNVTERLPIGGAHSAYGGVLQRPSGYLEPGVQRLTGYEALWYARSRFSSDDYSRMRRQRCLIGDLADQVDPVTLVRAFPRIASAAKADVRTGIRADDLSAWLRLAQRVKGSEVTSLALTGDTISTGDPDFTQIRRRVARAVEATQQPEPAATAPVGPGTPGTGAAPASSSSPSSLSASATRSAASSAAAGSKGSAGGASDLKSVCPPVR